MFAASGTMTSAVAQSWLVLQMTGSAIDIALITALTFLPTLLGGAWAGALVDRVDVRRLLIATNVVFAALAAAQAALIAAGDIRLWMLFAFAALNGAVFALDQPARQVSSTAPWLGPPSGASGASLGVEEITTRNGHFTALGLPAGTWIDWRYRAVDGALARFVQQIHRAGGLAVAAHPLATCVACGWKFGYAGLDAVEVWNGPWTLDDEAVLANWDNLLVASVRERGHDDAWLPAVGDSDAHSEPQVVGLPHNVVYAEGLDRRAILDGVRAGRLWIAESAAVDLSFTATAGGRSAGIGQRLRVAEDVPVTVTLQVSGAPGCAARFITDQGQRLATMLLAEGTATVTWTTTARNARYVRAEVRRQQPTPTTADTMVALTNPIFLGS
ncbi:CehA/McbA family metallohydrolase [Dactylosporangium sp. NPDC048998]|uniref:CehA/McbA family metallohydrolase n=1 Tax=Dactylosporangium sp. NPDC048998 TaxID=3363976 RepID=UPI003720A62B